MTPLRKVLSRSDTAALAFGTAASEALWTADPVLAGVEASWHRESKLMIAIRSEVVREFLEESVA
jgi:hypothetical protein